MKKIFEPQEVKLRATLPTCIELDDTPIYEQQQQEQQKEVPLLTGPTQDDGMYGYD